MPLFRHPPKPVHYTIEYHMVRNHGGPMRNHKGLILHVQEGNGSLRDYFDRPSVQASSTSWMPKHSPIIECYVDPRMEAWAQAAGNPDYNSVETEGFTNEPLTLNQVMGLGWLYRKYAAEYGWPFQVANRVGDHGLGWHGMGGSEWGGHYGCPGEIRKAQRAIVVCVAAGRDCHVGSHLEGELRQLKHELGLKPDWVIGRRVRQHFGLT